MTEFGAISYAAAGVFYAVLSLLLMTSWRGRYVGGYLIAACVISAVWAVTLAVQTMNAAVPAMAMFTLEVLRAGAWLTFLVVLLVQTGVSRPFRVLAHAVWIGALVCGIALWLVRDQFGIIADSGSALIPGGLLIALAGLMLIGQLYRYSPAASRWGIKALALGLGGLFAYDLFLYSQGLLLGVIDTTTWMARGAVNVLVIPLIAIAVRRNPEWDLRIFFSRQVIFYATSLVAIGLYLLLMSLVSYALLIYGGTWGGLAQIVFLAGAILVLITLLLSNTLRARAKVILSKHFFHNKYDYREEWLRLITTLAGFEDSSTRQIVIKAMAQIVNSPGGLLWALDENQHSYQLIDHYNSTHAVPNIAVGDRLVAFIKHGGWLIDVEEFKHEPKNYGDLELPAWLANNDDAWLIVPLMFRQELLGLVMLSKAAGPPQLNYEDRDLLKTVGNHLAVHLAQEKSDNLLAEAQQFEAYNRLTAFLMHDLNNLIAQQSLIIKNAEKHKRNPEFVDDAMQTIANSVNRMKRVMDQLTRGEADRLARATELKSILSTAVDRCLGKEPVPTLELNGVDASLDVDAERFTMVLTHLIQNAQDATRPDGTIAVSVEQDSGTVNITVADSGCGMTPEFVRDHLFRPFDSTKGSQGMGIGAYQAREFARKMGGELKVESVISQGTSVSLILPLN